MKSNSRIFLSLLILISTGLANAAESFHQIEIRTHKQTPVTLATSNDFSAAKIEGVDGKKVLSITLRTEAAKKVESWSSNHIGEPMDLVVDGSILASPTIRVVIQDGKFQVDSLDKRETKILAEAISQ